MNVLAFIVDDWVLDAACGTHPNPDLWFANHPKAAIAICKRCPVKDECLAEAIDNQIEYGIWGGMTVPQRARLARCVRCGKPSPAVASNPTRVRSYCGAECRYAAQRERVHTRVVPLALPPQPAVQYGTCQGCGDRFPQKRNGRPALYCSSSCRRGTFVPHLHLRTGGAVYAPQSPAAPSLAVRTNSCEFSEGTDQLFEETDA